jgi:hypothetical protein
MEKRLQSSDTRAATPVADVIFGRRRTFKVSATILMLVAFD